HLALLGLPRHEVLAPGVLVRLDGLVATLHLPRGHLADLVVAQLSAKLHLAVLDGRQQHAQRAEAHLLARAERILHLLPDPFLEGRSLIRHGRLPPCSGTSWPVSSAPGSSVSPTACSSSDRGSGWLGIASESYSGPPRR